MTNSERVLPRIQPTTFMFEGRILYYVSDEGTKHRVTKGAIIALFKHALELSKMVGKDISVTTLRRMEFVIDFGSPEIKQALDHKKISISRAYNIVKAEQDEQDRLFVHYYLRLLDEEREKPAGALEHG